MNRKGLVIGTLCKLTCLYVCCFFCFSPQQLKSQIVISPPQDHATLQELGFPPGSILPDTSCFHQFNARFLEEVGKKGFLNLDTLRTYGHAALREARNANYQQGLISVYLGMGAAFVDKYTIDSAKYYYDLAIKASESIEDKFLLARAYFGLGWSLIYETSNYEGSVTNIKEALRLAEEVKDTSLMINLTIQLNRVYYLQKDFKNGYALSHALIDFCEKRKDTSDLIYNYFLLASQLSEMSLRDREMQIVYKALQWKPHVTDTLSSYLINQMASNGYLRNHQYDSALYYAWLNVPQAINVRRYPHCYFNIAKAHLKLNALDSARYYYEKILDIQKANGMYVNVYQYLDMGNIEFRSGNDKKAYNYYKLAEANIAKPPLDTQRDIYKALYEYYDHHRDYVEAFHYLEKYKVMADSIQSSENALAEGVALVEKESTDLENQVKLLTKDMQLQTAIADKQRQEEGIMVGSMALIMIAAGLAFVRFRKNRMIKNRQELLNERLRISRELHDEVGSTLSGVSMYSHLAKEQLKTGDQVQTENSLNIIQRSAGEMVNKLSDIVWLINPEQDTISELFQRLEEYARQMTSARNMRIVIELPSSLSDTHIKLDARRNIYLFFKEAINNAVKYSEGNELQLVAKLVGNKIRFSISDDGKGFDEMTIRRGNGLANMLKRAEDIGAIFRIDTKPNKGVTIEMDYKLTH